MPVVLGEATMTVATVVEVTVVEEAMAVADQGVTDAEAEEDTGAEAAAVEVVGMEDGDLTCSMVGVLRAELGSMERGVGLGWWKGLPSKHWEAVRLDISKQKALIVHS